MRKETNIDALAAWSVQSCWAGAWVGINPASPLLKQRYSTEASLQHRHLRDPPPGRLPQPIGGHGQQQLRAHQRGRQGLRQEEEKHPDVSPPGKPVRHIWEQQSEGGVRTAVSKNVSLSFCLARGPKPTGSHPEREEKKKRTQRTKKKPTKKSRNPETGPLSAPSPSDMDRKQESLHPSPC